MSFEHGIHVMGLTICQFRSGHLSAFSKLNECGSTYSLSGEERRVFISVNGVLSMSQHLLSVSWEEGREHSSALSVRTTCCTTYFLLFEEGKGALVRIQCVLRMWRHLQSVSWAGEGMVSQQPAGGGQVAAHTCCCAETGK